MWMRVVIGNDLILRYRKRIVCRCAAARPIYPFPVVLYASNIWMRTFTSNCFTTGPLGRIEIMCLFVCCCYQVVSVDMLTRSYSCDGFDHFAFALFLFVRDGDWGGAEWNRLQPVVVCACRKHVDVNNIALALLVMTSNDVCPKHCNMPRKEPQSCPQTDTQCTSQSWNNPVLPPAFWNSVFR